MEANVQAGIAFVPVFLKDDIFMIQTLWNAQKRSMSTTFGEQFWLGGKFLARDLSSGLVMEV
jgi:hypothetical protein